MGCSSSLPDRSAGRVGGLNPDNADSDAKNLRVKETIYSEMSPLDSVGISLYSIRRSSVEIDGIVKVQPIATVEKKVFHSLGWTNLEFLKEKRMVTSTPSSREEYQTQVYYQYGIFSIIYRRDEMPNWITNRSKGSSILFTIPSSPKKLRDMQHWLHFITAVRLLELLYMI